MKSSRIVKLLGLLDSHAIYPGHKSVNEVKDFGKWLESPWAGSNQKQTILYNALIEHYPDFPASILTKQKLFTLVYPNKPYHDKLMRNLLSELTKQLENYFAHSYLRRNSKVRKEALLDSFFERKNLDEAIKVARNDLKANQNMEAKGADDHLKAFYLEKRILQNPKVRTQSLTQQDLLNNLEQNLDTFYAIQKIKILADKNDRQNFTNDQKINFQNELKYLFELIKDQNHSLLEIYKILLLDQSNDYDRFKRANEKFRESFNQLVVEDQKLILVRLQNILINLYSKGHEEVVRDIFELGCFGIETKLLIEKGKITDRTFNNIVSTGNEVGAFDYVRTFIDTYYNKIDRKFSKDIKAWANAHYAYHQGEFNQCIAFVYKCSTKHHLFSNRSRTLELMAYFELYTTQKSHFEILNSRLKSFRRNIQRDKVLAKNRKASYLAFLSNFGKLAKLVYVKDESDKQQKIVELEDAISTHKNILFKFWLLKQLKKLREDSIAIPPKLV